MVGLGQAENPLFLYWHLHGWPKVLAPKQRIKENLTAGTFRELFPLQVSKDNEKQKGFLKRIEKKKTFR